MINHVRQSFGAVEAHPESGFIQMGNQGRGMREGICPEGVFGQVGQTILIRVGEIGCRSTADLRGRKLLGFPIGQRKAGNGQGGGGVAGIVGIGNGGLNGVAAEFRRSGGGIVVADFNREPGGESGRGDAPRTAIEGLGKV